MSEPTPNEIYKNLRKHFGFLNWWPGETSFEIFVGAILTQQTTWKNVEKAIKNLKSENSLSLEIIANMNLKKLQKLVRPSGFYKQKAKRLKNICKIIIKNHKNLENLLKMNAEKLRTELLSYNGIGRETADSIILYASNQPIFVIDAYTKRIMDRINPKIGKNFDYDDLRRYFENGIKKNTEYYKDFHAQFVELGKNYCKTNPLCTTCPLSKICYFSSKIGKYPN